MKKCAIIALLAQNYSVGAFSNNKVTFSRLDKTVPISKTLHKSAINRLDKTMRITQSFIQSRNVPNTRSNSLNMLPIDIADPVLQATALSDMALGLDIASLLTPEASVFARTLALVGRILCITSDYIPDHTISPDELGFQMTMLGLSAQLLVKSMIPVVRASSTPLSIRDKRAYCSLFRPYGVSPLQYRSALSEMFDWVEVQPNADIDSENNKYVYWLYDGDVKIESDRTDVRHVEKKKGTKTSGSVDISLLGNVNYNHVALSPKGKDITLGAGGTSKEILKAGEKGATLLRINSAQCSDDILNRSFKSIQLDSIQEMINTRYSSKLVPV